MDDQVLIQQAIEPAEQFVEYKVNELTQFQLATVGGGCAEVCPY